VVDEQGWFWLPENSKDRIAGSLQIDDSILRLQLLGLLPPDRLPDDATMGSYPRRLPEGENAAHEVVHARLRTGHFYSLFNVRGWDGGGFRIPTVQFDDESLFDSNADMWASWAIHDLLVDDPPKLAKLRFRLDGLAGVLGRHRGIRHFKPIPDVGWVPMSFPEIEPLIVRWGNWKLSAESVISGLDEQIVFSACPDEARSLQEFVTDMLEPLVWLARFCARRWQQPSDLQVWIPEASEEDDQWFPLTCPSLTHSPDRQAPPNSQRPTITVNSFVPKEIGASPSTIQDYTSLRDPIRTNLLTGWLSWFTSSDENRSAVRASLSALITPDPPELAEEFRASIGAVEILADSRVAEIPEEEREQRLAIAQALQSADANLIGALGTDPSTVVWAADRLRSGLSKGLSRQIAELLATYVELAPLLRRGRNDTTAESAKNVAKGLAGVRGSLSHMGGGATADRELLGWRCDQAQLIVVGIVLSEVSNGTLDQIPEIIAACTHTMR